MTRLTASLKMFCMALACAAAVLGASLTAMADTLHLKDGRVLSGTVEKEEGGVVWFKVVVGKIEQRQIFMQDEITKIERDSDSAPVVAEAKVEKPKSNSSGHATRVAILNFGPPSSWQGKVDNTVGIEISVQAWKDAIPLLEKDGVQVVIVRVNSGGGLANEVPKFLELYQKQYKPRFRTVGWIESAISAAAMSPYCLEEMYFLPEGNLGGCTAFSGRLQEVKGLQLEEYLAMMENASRDAGRDPKIMRAMQIMEPLSCNIDPQTGEVTWFQDVSGDHIINGLRPDGKAKILTLNASDAMKTKFARGIASTVEELMAAMGIQEYEIAGKQATDYIDDHMRKSDNTDKRLNEVYSKYQIALQAAAALGGEDNKQRRGAEVGRARRFLDQMRQMLRINPNFAFMYPFDEAWFDEQERILRDLMR